MSKLLKPPAVPSAIPNFFASQPNFPALAATGGSCCGFQLLRKSTRLSCASRRHERRVPPACAELRRERGEPMVLARGLPQCIRAHLARTNADASPSRADGTGLSNLRESGYDRLCRHKQSPSSRPGTDPSNHVELSPSPEFHSPSRNGMDWRKALPVAVSGRLLFHSRLFRLASRWQEQRISYCC